MKEVHVVSYCDEPSHPSRVEATVERTITVDGTGPIVLDLCAAGDRNVQAMLALMEHGTPAQPMVRRGPGRPPGRPAVRIGQGEQYHSKETPAWYRTCPLDGKVSPTRSALGQHMNKKHERKLSEFEWVDPDQTAQPAVQ